MNLSASVVLSQKRLFADIAEVSYRSDCLEGEVLQVPHESEGWFLAPSASFVSIRLSPCLHSPLRCAVPHLLLLFLLEALRCP